MGHNRHNPYLAAGLTAFAVIAGALLLFFLLFHFRTVAAYAGTIAGILRPIFMGAVIAFLLVPVHRWISGLLLEAAPKNRRVRRALNFLSILLSLALAILLIYVLLAMVIPQVWQSIVDLVLAVPDYIVDFQSWLRTFLEDNPDIQSAALSVYASFAASLEQWLNSDILPNLESVTATLDWLRSDILPNVTGVVTGVSVILLGLFNLVKDLVIAIIVSAYLLARKDVLAAQSKKIVYSLLPTRAADLIVNEARSAYRIMSGFITGSVLVSLIIGVVCFVFCSLFQFPYPALIATIIGVTNVIPFFGPFIGAVPSIFLIFIVNPIQSLYFAIFLLVMQQLDGNILTPKVLGGSTGLDSFWVLFSIILFGGLFGFAGMVLGVPVFAMVYSVISRLVRLGLRRHALPEDTGEYLGRTEPMSREKTE